MNSKCCVEMEGDETHLVSPDGKIYKFTYDYSYWSHEESAPNYASQTTVYNDLGKSVLDNAWEGYNTSLFAYGQTGSGKVRRIYTVIHIDLNTWHLFPFHHLSSIIHVSVYSHVLTSYWSYWLPPLICLYRVIQWSVPRRTTVSYLGFWESSLIEWTMRRELTLE